MLAEKFFTLCFLAIILQGLLPAQALVRRYRFELGYTSHTRLCTNKSMLTVNGQFPGPTIYARRGDLVIVDVINNAYHNITIHWHGVKMLRNPWYDGAGYVTQCPLTPGKKFTQRIILSDEEGTLWWHAHNGWVRNSVYGALVILPSRNEIYPFPKPHAEFPVLLGDWWNADLQQLYDEFIRSGSAPAVNDAFLINGLPGNLYRISCSKQDIYRISVEFGKTYLIRMINAAMDNVMFFKITNHNFTVVGTDGTYIKPFITDYIAIATGQTVDFLVEANQLPTRYYMAARLQADGGEFVKIPTTGYLEYVGNYTSPSFFELPSFPAFNSTLASDGFFRQLRSLADNKHPIAVPKNVTENLFFVLTINLRPCLNMNCSGRFGERFLAAVNNVTLVLPVISFLEAYYYNLSGVYQTNFPDYPPFPYNYTQENMPSNLMNPEDGTSVKILEYNTTVELVFQGINNGGGVEHPMHLHGHNFYVVGSGFGNFNRSRDPANYNLVDPPLMQTITVPRNGWTAIRFKANNPGVWYLHCHFERHASTGMGMVFIVKDGERPNEKMLPPPPDMPLCDDRSIIPGKGGIEDYQEKRLNNHFTEIRGIEMLESKHVI